MGLNLKPEPNSDKLYWVDGFWSDPRWRLFHTLPEEECRKLYQEIKNDWSNLDWVEQTEWFKEKIAAGEIDLRHLKASRKNR